MTKIYHFLFLCFICTISTAQGPLYQHWSTTYINEAGEALEELSLVHAIESGILVAGQSASSLGYDMYVAKYDYESNLVWEKHIDTPNNSTFTHLVIDANGDYYLMGYEIQAQFFDRLVHLAKVSSTGELVWHSIYAGPNDTFAWAMDLVLAHGKLHISGREAHPNGFNSGFVAQFDLDGELIWAHDDNPDFGNELTHLTVAPNGHITAVGFADGGYQLYAIQYDEYGNNNWTYYDSLGDYEEESYSNVTSDEQGNLYIQSTRETGSFEESVYTEKRTDSFELIWEHVFDNNGYNKGYSVELGSGGTVYSFFEQEDNFNRSGYVIKLNSSGEELFSVSDEVGNGTVFERGILGVNEQIILGTRSLESFGLSTFSAEGEEMHSSVYDLSHFNYMTGISSFDDKVIVVGKEAFGLNSALLSLNSADLSENFFFETNGEPMPDARPGKIVVVGSELWLSVYGKSGSEATLSIVKLDPSGNTLWEHSVTQESAYPDFDQLEADVNGNIVGLYQNNMNVQSGRYGLVKVDNQGNEIFNVTVDDNDEYVASALALDNLGNIYVAGYDLGNQLMFLEKYSPLGSQIWQETYQSPSDPPLARPLDMKHSAQGKLVIGASHRGSTGDSELHLFQYTDDGELEWHHDVVNQGGNQVYLFDMEVDDEGKIILFGSSGYGHVAAKYNISGTEEWSYAGNNPVGEAPRSMCRDESDNVYLGFSSVSYARFVKLNTEGLELEETSISSNASGGYYYPDDCVFVDGKLVALGRYLMGQYGTVSIQMVLNDNLETLQVEIDSTQTAEFHTSALDGNGNIYSAYLTGAIALGKGSRSTIVKKFSMSPVGLDELNSNEIGLNLWPNPSSGELNIRFANQHIQLRTVRFRDVRGALVYHLDFGDGQQETWSFKLPDDFDQGLYLVEMETNKGRLVRRVLVD